VVDIFPVTAFGFAVLLGVKSWVVCSSSCCFAVVGRG
jgi:hypothetical protein